MNRQFKNKTTLSPIVGIGLVILFSFLFIWIGENLLLEFIVKLDTMTIEFFQTIQSNFLDQWMLFITQFGSVGLIGMLSLFILLLLWYRGSSSWEITSFVMTVGAGGILLFLLKEFYVRERPMFHPFIDVGGYSFPSGHAMGAVLLYGFIIYSFRQNRPSPFQKWSFTIVVGIFIFLIGISRIYLGVHFPTDVLAGYFAGLAWLIACILPLEWKKRRS